jgi:hypothetical protein
MPAAATYILTIELQFSHTIIKIWELDSITLTVKGLIRIYTNARTRYLITFRKDKTKFYRYQIRIFF